MGWVEDLIGALIQPTISVATQPGAQAYFGAAFAMDEVIKDLLSGGLFGKGGETSLTDEARARGKAQLFLIGSAGAIAGIAALPLLYSFTRKKKDRKEKIALASESSRNAVTMLSAFAPAVALPSAYILVDKMETAQLISGPLGDDAQALMVAMAGGTVAGSLAKLLGVA